MSRRSCLRARPQSVCMEMMENRTLLSTYMVTNTNDAGTGSLRQAILNANASSSTDTIKFAIGSGQKTILPHSALPVISQPVTIDGTTQPGFGGKPIIEINGSSAGGVDGIKITASHITIRGLDIDHFAGSGIFIYKGSYNKIAGNWIGIDKSGSNSAGNKAHGIIVQGQNNVIGGTTSADRNVISGNAKAGVFFYLADGAHNIVEGNYIGTDYTGTKSIANNNGVQINGAQYITVGGTTSGARNIISGNTHDGVLMVTTGSKFNNVQGNYIGTNAAGTARLGNGWYGVEISQPYNVVGGTSSAYRNVISANGYDGVALYLSTGAYNTVEGNYIGTDYTGTKDLGNTGAGVCCTNDANNNMIGGTSSADRNIIAGNDLYGVGIYNHSTYNTIENNYIGIGATGYSLPNTKNPISIWISDHTSIHYNRIVQSGKMMTIAASAGLTTIASADTIYGIVAAGLKVV